MSDITDSLAVAFGEHTDADTAQTAAENVAAFARQYDEALTADDVLARFEDAPAAEFTRAFNWLVGDLAAGTEDCTDSREFRIGGPGDHAADPTITG
ncbi:hypothetical protein [Haloarcula onubensis]|uniref:Uncharacterized protein n=1 Tax=Haloarcula onubensis TaxID=2950539 RepID=A0ABU2FNX1_9EURY|nr:hypothetical protein [Halomicroarcula sp. S3CR25-11]MDS0282463.1 hypothetical protein [Halomicroarcula sp. S3CR25-11]